MKTQRVTIAMSEAELANIDNWVEKQQTKSRAEAIRTLIKLGLAASQDPSTSKSILQAWLDGQPKDRLNLMQRAQIMSVIRDLEKPS